MVIPSSPFPIRPRVIPHIPIPKLAISILIHSTEPADSFHDAFVPCSPGVKLFQLNRVVKTQVDLGSVLVTHANGEVMRAERVFQKIALNWSSVKVYRSAEPDRFCDDSCVGTTSVISTETELKEACSWCRRDCIIRAPLPAWSMVSITFRNLACSEIAYRGRD